MKRINNILFLLLPIVFLFSKPPQSIASTSLAELQLWINANQQNEVFSPAVKKMLQTTEDFIKTKQIDSVIYYLNATRTLLKKDEIPIDLTLAIGALYCNDLQSYNKAKDILIPTLTQISKSDQVMLYLKALNLVTKSHYWLFESEETMNYAVEGLELAKTIKNTEYERIFTQWVGRALAIQGHFKEALGFYQKGLDLALITDDPFVKYEAYLNLACGNYKDKNTEDGLTFLSHCYDYLDEIENNEKLKADVWMWDGIMNGAIGNYEKGIRLLTKAIPIFDRLDIAHRRMHTRLELGGIYLKEKKNTEAVQVVEEAFLLDPKKITPFEKKFGYTLLYQANKNLANNSKAIHYLEALNEVNAQLDAKNNARYIQELEQQYQEKEQQQTINQQQIIISRRRWFGLALGLVSILLLGTFYALYLFNKNRKKLTAQNLLIEKQSQELRQLDKLKSNFFANVSHELRTPLTLMLGPVSSALKSGTLDHRNFTLLNKAKQSGQELLEMVGTILDLSKLEAKKMDVRWNPELLFPLARRIAAAFESQAQIKDIRYTFHYKAEQNLYIELDKNKVTIILNNLLSNALKFTQSGGEIIFSVEDINNLIQFSVTDTGRGIHPEDLPYVFDRFYQSKQENIVEGGTGIGLALTKEFAQLMGGTVQVKSQMSVGSTFTASIIRREVFGTKPSIPDPVDQNLVPVTKEINQTPTSNSTILIVEDNISLRTYLNTILSPYYHVILADNGLKALDILNSREAADYPNLILSDIMMPEMDGYQLLKILKSKDYFRPIPVIMLTARADVEDKLKALRIGVDDYLLKPFEEEELLARIENLLLNEQERRAQIQEAQTEEIEEAVIIPSISKEDQAWLEELEMHLHRELSNNNYTITQLSYDIALSERQLRRRIKQLVGLSPAQYFKSIRLQHARKLLEQKHYNTIAQTAAAVGFQDTSAFSRNFSQQFGKLPSSYLKN